MLRNYLKTAWRSLSRSPLFTSIKILGLGFGILISIPIFLIIKDEISFDNFHSKHDSIYRAWVDEEYGDGVDYFSTVTPRILGPTLESKIPEVENFTRYESFQEYVQQNDELFSEQFTLVDPGFFTIFDFEVKSGSTNKIFQDPYEVVLSEESAIKYFGSESAIGKPLKIRLTDSFQEFKVVAVLENPPSNSSITYNVLLPYENIRKRTPEKRILNWFQIYCETYVLLKKGVDVPSEAKFNDMLQSELGEDYTPGSYALGLQPLTDIHLNADFPEGIAPVSDPEYSIILGTIAILVLILGSLNFTTLALGKSLSRAKEVGVRKVVGANKAQIRNQFLGESFLTALIAMICSVGILPLLLPTFSALSGRNLVISPTLINIIFMLALLLVIAFISGSYPALILSRLKPALIVKGNMKAGAGKQRILKWLTGTQLILSLFLISSMLIMKNQLNFLQSRNLGFKEDHVAVLNISTTNSMNMAASIEKASLLKNEVDGHSAVKGVAFATQNFNGLPWISVSFPDANEITRAFNFNVISSEFIPLMEIELLEGKNFTGWGGENRNSIIVNEAFVKYFNLDQPLGKSIPGPEFPAHEIIGVVKDFHYMSLHSQIEPLALVVDPNLIYQGINNISLNQSTNPKAFIKLKGENIPEGVEVVKQGWEKVFPSEPFEITFLDDNIQRQYEAEQRLGKIVSGAASLAILIAAMGLFALSSLIISGRRKEIGIRKVLGAEVFDITLMMTREFLMISFIALIIAVPLSMYIMNDWLQEFQYRVGVEKWPFILTGACAITLCLITVTAQSFRAALKNPVDSIGSD